MITLNGRACNKGEMLSVDVTPVKQKVQISYLMNLVNAVLTCVYERKPGFCSMKQLGALLLPSGWDASPSWGYL